MSNISIENKILNSIKKCGRGKIFFASDFANYGEKKSINKALERMTLNGYILRVSRGIYYYPKIDKVLGLGFLSPTIEDIANGIAKRDKARIAPTGLYALNRLGFSTQIPMNIQFYTDASQRKLTLDNGATIEFKHTAPKNLAFNSQLAMLLTFAFRSIGKENISEDILAKTKELLQNKDSGMIDADYKLMPAWIATIIRSINEK